MKNNRCPYIGLKDDPNTALDFPSQGNTCYRAQPESPIKGIHQEHFCLTGQHVDCPVFKATKPGPMPAQLAGLETSNTVSKRTMAAVGIPVLIAGAAAITFAWNILSTSIDRPPNTIPNSGASAQAQPGWALIPKGNPQSSEATSVPTSEPLLVNCPLPSGWVPYTVNPTDSLYRLSVIFGVSVQMLQSVNCLGEDTAILSGQVIYVPFIPTRTAISTPTSIPFVPSNTSPAPLPVQVEYQPPAGNNNGNEAQPGSPTDSPAKLPTDPATIAPTQVPPTRIPPTAIPATAVPAVPLPANTIAPPPARPTDVPPTSKPPKDEKTDDKNDDKKDKDEKKDEKKDKDNDNNGKGNDKDEDD